MLLLAFVALSIAVVTLDFRQNSGGPIKRARDLTVTVVAPIQRGFTTVTRPVGGFFSSLAELTNLRGENERLKALLDQAEADADGLPQIEAENRELHEHFKLEKHWTTMDSVLAPVISNSPSNYKWAVVIGKGKRQGVRLDNAVLNPDGLVGKIIRVDRNYSTVLLLVDPAAAATASVGGLGDSGLVEGNGGGERLTLSSIDVTSDVSVGDEVVTWGATRESFLPASRSASLRKWVAPRPRWNGS